MQFKITFIFSLAILLYSCSECEDSILMGEFQISEESKAFVPYSGSETLMFEDNTGTIHELKSQRGRVLEASKLIVRTLCEKSFLDRTEQFFNTEREQLAYFDNEGNQIFYTDLFPQSEDRDNIDSISIYDQLTISAVVNGSSVGNIKIITEELQNQVSETHRNDFVQHSRLIGDTTLYERPFTGVFVDVTGEGKGIYYNKEKGVLAFKLSEEEFWVLQE